MSGREPGGLIRDVRVLFGAGTVAGQTDGQLLERFVGRRDARRRGGVRRPRAAARPDGLGRLPPRLERSARRRGRLPGHLPGAGPQRGERPGRRLAGALAVRREPARSRSGPGAAPTGGGPGNATASSGSPAEVRIGPRRIPRRAGRGDRPAPRAIPRGGGAMRPRGRIV